MIWLYILLSVLAVFLLILFCPISIYLVFDEEFKLYVKIFFIKFSLPLNKKTTSKKPKKKKKTQTKPKKNKTDGQSFTEKLSEVVELVTSIRDRMLKTLTVKKLIILVTAASDDPGSTAMIYGGVNAVVYPLVSLVGEYMKIKNKQIEITADYSKDSTEVIFFAKISTFPARVLGGAIGVLTDVILKD